MNGNLITKIISSSVVLIMLVAFAGPAAAQEEEFYYQRAIIEKYTDRKAEIISAVNTPQGSDLVWSTVMVRLPVTGTRPPPPSLPPLE